MNNQARGGRNSNCRWAGILIVADQGPQSTLQRGFAIVRDDEDKPLTSREAAMNHASFQIQFHDGRVMVENTDGSGGMSDERRDSA